MDKVSVHSKLLDFQISLARLVDWYARCHMAQRNHQVGVVFLFTCFKGDKS